MLNSILFSALYIFSTTKQQALFFKSFYRIFLSAFTSFLLFFMYVLQINSVEFTLQNIYPVQFSLNSHASVLFHFPLQPDGQWRRLCIGIDVDNPVEKAFFLRPEGCLHFQRRTRKNCLLGYSTLEVQIKSVNNCIFLLI